MKSKAEEMFEEHNFNLAVDTDYVIVYENRDLGYFIEFDLILKGWFIKGFNFITIDCLKAINQQCKELGWL